MKNQVSLLALLLIFPSFLAGCMPKVLQRTAEPEPKVPQRAAGPEPNFGFRLESGACYTDVLDTFNGTLTKDLISEPAFTIPFHLPHEQMIAVFEKMVQIGFFDYPAIFSIPTPRFNQAWVIQTPAERYHILVRNGTASKTLDWIDEIREPDSREAQNLRALFEIITDMISSSPEYQHLPARNGGCG
jgi:hypothetical protein